MTKVYFYTFHKHLIHSFFIIGEALKSDIFCVIFGTSGVVLFFTVQLLLANISKWFERTYTNMKLYRIIYEDIMYIFVYLTLLLLWRGCWNMNTRYVITDPALGGPVNYVLGLVALLSLRTFSVVSGCGCVRDGEETLGGAFFPIKYLYIYTNPQILEKVRQIRVLQHYVVWCMGWKAGNKLYGSLK